MNDGESYSRLQSNKVQKYSIKDGQFLEDLFALEMLADGVDALPVSQGIALVQMSKRYLLNPTRRASTDIHIKQIILFGQMAL